VQKHARLDKAGHVLDTYGHRLRNKDDSTRDAVEAVMAGRVTAVEQAVE
jgi:hypothetical protein